MRATLAIALTSFLVGVAPKADAQTALKGNRYLCYVVEKISGGGDIPEAKAKDQFGAAPATIKKPGYVCNPVALNGRAIADAQMHIVCYEATTTLPPETRTVLIRNQFDNAAAPLNIELGPAKLLCVPSLKKDITKRQ